MPRYMVTLTDEEINDLETMIQKGGKGYRIKHAQILLKLDQRPENAGWTYDRIKDAYKTCHSTIAGIAKRFVMEGMEAALGRKKQENRYRKVTGDVEAMICTIACSDPPEGATRWTMQAIADELIRLEAVDYITDSTICKDQVSKTLSSYTLTSDRMEYYADLGKSKSVGGSETAPGTGQWSFDLDPGQYYLKITDNVGNAEPSGIYDLSWTMSPKATGISLSRTHTDLYIGQSIGSSASITPENVADRTITWRSANPAIVRMSDDGTITGIAPGETSVSATTTDGTALTATCFVTVKEPTLSVDTTPMTLDVSQTDQIAAETEPASDITFTSSDDAIASVTAGTVQAKKAPESI